MIDLKKERIVWQKKGLCFVGENRLACIDDKEESIGIWDFDMKTCYQRIPLWDGALVNGCKFTNLHPDSKIDRDLLKKFGAEV